jgi:hypothetical protein
MVHDVRDIDCLCNPCNHYSVPSRFVPEAEIPHPLRTSPRPLATFVVLSLTLGLSPLTSVADPWLDERRRRDSTVTVVIPSGGPQVITRSQALQLAREILLQAEARRLEAARWEAERGIDWILDDDLRDT